MYSVRGSLLIFWRSTLVSGSGITFAYLFFTSAPAGSSSIFAETCGIPANSSLIALMSLQKDESPAKFNGWDGIALCKEDKWTFYRRNSVFSSFNGVERSFLRMCSIIIIDLREDLRENKGEGVDNRFDNLIETVMFKLIGVFFFT